MHRPLRKIDTRDFFLMISREKKNGISEEHTTPKKIHRIETTWSGKVKDRPATRRSREVPFTILGAVNELLTPRCEQRAASREKWRMQREGVGKNREAGNFSSTYFPGRGSPLRPPYITGVLAPGVDLFVTLY